jgi:hypothetical protein
MVKKSRLVLTPAPVKTPPGRLTIDHRLQLHNNFRLIWTKAVLVGSKQNKLIQLRIPQVPPFLRLSIKCCRNRAEGLHALCETSSRWGPRPSTNKNTAILFLPLPSQRFSLRLLPCQPVDWQGLRLLHPGCQAPGGRCCGSGGIGIPRPAFHSFARLR